MTRTIALFFSACMFIAHCYPAFAGTVNQRAQPPVTTLYWNEPFACLQIDNAYSPQCIHDLYAIGMRHLQAQVYAKAIVRFDQILSMKAYALVYGNRGVAHAGLGNLDRARADFEKTVSMNPTLHHAWYNLARIDIAQRQPRRALGHITRAIDLDSGVAEYHEVRADLYKRLRQPARAAADTRAVAAIRARETKKDSDHARVADQPAQ